MSRVERCEWCGGVFFFEDLDLCDADGGANEPCVCGTFEAELDLYDEELS